MAYDEEILTCKDQLLGLYCMAMALRDFGLQIADGICPLSVDLPMSRTAISAYGASRESTTPHTWKTFCCSVLTVIFMTVLV